MRTNYNREIPLLGTDRHKMKRLVGSLFFGDDVRVSILCSINSDLQDGFGR